MKPEKKSADFWRGARDVLAVAAGVIPFGLVMGKVCAGADYSLARTVSSNFLLYAGTAQLTAVELMRKEAATLVVVATGLFVNARYVMYSAAMSPYLAGEKGPMKLLVSYSLTDQAYAVMSANQESLTSREQTLRYYLGASAVVYVVWQVSVIAGYVLGELALSKFALDYAIPASFIALLIPTLKSRAHVFVALASALLSLLLHGLPFNSGLLVTAIAATVLGAFLTFRRKAV